MAPPDDIEGLIAKLAARDARAFGDLYDRTVGFVFGLLLRILNDRDAAEEVAQEVYLQLWRNAATFDPARSSALAWIATIGRTRALDRLRAEGSRRLAMQGLGQQPPPTRPPNPEEEASLGERREKVLGALETLPAEQRSTIELAYFAGLTHTEIASRTGTPLGTVKTRIRAAIEKLEQALGHLRG